MSLTNCARFCPRTREKICDRPSQQISMKLRLYIPTQEWKREEITFNFPPPLPPFCLPSTPNSLNFDSFFTLSLILLLLFVTLSEEISTRVVYIFPPPRNSFSFEHNGHKPNTFTCTVVIARKSSPRGRRKHSHAKRREVRIFPFKKIRLIVLAQYREIVRKWSYEKFLYRIRGVYAHTRYNGIVSRELI